MRPALNVILAVGYLAGLLLVWVGIKLIAFEREQLAAGICGVALGIAWWAMLVAIGKRTRSLTKQERADHVPARIDIAVTDSHNRGASLATVESFNEAREIK